MATPSAMKACAEAQKDSEAPIDPKKPVRGAGHGGIKVNWTPQTLPYIVKRLCDKYPTISYITVSKNEISWNFELGPEDLIPTRKEIREMRPLKNPSRREPNSRKSGMDIIFTQRPHP